MDALVLIAILVLSNWGLPFLLWSYPLYGLIVGDFRYVGHYGPFACYKLAKGINPGHAQLWKDWSGVGLYFFMVFRDCPGPEDDAQVDRTKKHEGAHCWHWVYGGLLTYAAYVLHMIWIYLCEPDKHPYLDCWSERLARKAAGQIVDVPREWWPDGPKDRWPWW